MSEQVQTVTDALGREFVPATVEVPSWYEDTTIAVPWVIAQDYPSDVWWEEIEQDLEEA